MVKLIQGTGTFKIKLSRGNVKDNKFVDLFAKGSTIMNTGISLKN